MAASTEVLGIADLRTKFAELRNIDRGARRATVAGGQVLKRKAREIAQTNGSQRTGALINNIVIKRERTPGGLVQYHLGVRHGRRLTRKQKAASYLAVSQQGRIVKRYENDPFYWRFVEFGTTPHTIGQKGRRGKTLAWTQVPRPTRFARFVRHPGAPAKPFLVPALEQGKEAAIDAMRRTMAKEVERQARSGA